MTRQELNPGDKVIVGTIPEGKHTNNRARKIVLRNGIILQLEEKFAAVDMGKYIECFDYGVIQRG